jgi:hypothetical protein
MDYDDLRVAGVLVATAHELPVPVVLMEDTQDRMILFRNSAAGKAAPVKTHVHGLLYADGFNPAKIAY